MYMCKCCIIQVTARERQHSTHTELLVVQLLTYCSRHPFVFKTLSNLSHFHYCKISQSKHNILLLFCVTKN